MNRRKKVKRLGAKTISFPKGKGHLTHNNREFISNNVVPERTVWNRIYIQESLEQAYEKCFGQALRDYNVAQKRKDRRKENYLKEIENSGNKEKTFYENIVQIGKKDDTPVVGADGKLTEEAKAAIEILEQYAKTFQERNPNLYLFNCVMHLDEATPHLIKNSELLNEQECQYAMNPATHLDFLIYNRIGKKPVLAIEVDGYEYHKEDTVQASRDLLKNHIMESYEISLLRFMTNGSGEKEKIIEMLDKSVE